jgi:hypothetical protein
MTRAKKTSIVPRVETPFCDPSSTVRLWPRYRKNAFSGEFWRLSKEISRFWPPLKAFHLLVKRFHSLVKRFQSRVKRFQSGVKRLQLGVMRFQKRMKRFQNLIKRFQPRDSIRRNICCEVLAPLQGAMDYSSLTGGLRLRSDLRLLSGNPAGCRLADVLCGSHRSCYTARSLSAN